MCGWQSDLYWLTRPIRYSLGLPVCCASLCHSRNRAWNSKFQWKIKCRKSRSQQGPLESKKWRGLSLNLGIKMLYIVMYFKDFRLIVALKSSLKKRTYPLIFYCIPTVLVRISFSRLVINSTKMTLFYEVLSLKEQCHLFLVSLWISEKHLYRWKR